MKCLGLEKIYLYLDKELPSAERKSIELHLATCPKCKKAVEQRRSLHQAAESLLLWEIPPDFPSRIMTRILPAKVSLRSWVTAMSVGLSSIILALLAFFLFSGESLSGLFINLYQTLLNHVRSLSIFFVKLFKILSLLVRMIFQFANFLFKGFAYFTTILSPEVQIILIVLTLIFSVSIFYGVKRKLIIGEKA